MENNENFVTEQVTEPVEQTTEQAPKMFTQEEVNDIVGKAKARTKAKVEKDYQRKYGGLEEVLKAGTGMNSVEEVTDSLRNYYASKGKTMPEKPQYSRKDIEVLANAEADDIIRSGYEDVVEEVERLAAIGADSMTDREKAVYVKLAEHRKNADRGRELSKLGVTEEEYTSKEFMDFAGKFQSSTPISDIYEIYSKTKPKKEIRTMGSMTSDASPDNGIKDFYSYEEAVKFTKADFDKNPALYKKVQESMTKWK